MNTQLDLAARVRRSIAHADAGNATMMILQPDEIQLAKLMIGDHPVIAASPQEARTFLAYLQGKRQAKRKRTM
jgi:hypothetical protein